MRGQPFLHNRAYVTAGITEAVRISKLVAPSPLVVPYTWYRYHSEPAPDAHALEFLTAKDTELQFSYPLTLPGVKQLIIWGDEGSNATKEAILKAWIKVNADVFNPPVDRSSNVVHCIGCECERCSHRVLS